MNFGGVDENVVTREEFPLEKAREILKDETIAVIGYGVQGPGQSMNLRDNGFNVIVGQRKGSKTWDKAVADGWVPGETLFEIEEACQRGTIIEYLLSDAAQIEVWPKVKKHLTAGKTLYFSHGFAITYKERTGIVPPADVDVFMAAPKGPGHTVRGQYVIGQGVPCLVAVEQDATGNCKNIALAYIAGIGGARAGIMETTMDIETETDLFGEQTVLCGGVIDLMQCGFETLCEAGYAPENAYFECIHEMKLIVDLINKGGVAAMNYSISDTAEYGEYVSGPRVIDHEQVKANMRAVLSDIQDGSFAGRWIAENKNGRTFFNSKRAALAKHPMETVGEYLRENMLWKNNGTGDADLDAASK